MKHFFLSYAKVNGKNWKNRRQKKKKQFTDKTSFFNYNDKYTSLPQKDTSQHSKHYTII